MRDFPNTHTSGGEATMQGRSVHQEQLGVQCLSQGYVDTWPEGVGDRTTDLAITG